MTSQRKARIRISTKARGGFRWPWLARVTRGRLGLGRWTQEEVDEINRRARERYERLAPFLDKDN